MISPNAADMPESAALTQVFSTVTDSAADVAGPESGADVVEVPHPVSMRAAEARNAAEAKGRTWARLGVGVAVLFMIRVPLQREEKE
ncbi:hypothetical protein ACFPRL_19995 [Pseudoclavibacter helvolus]